MPNRKIVFDDEADYGIEPGVEYEVFDSKNGEMYPCYIVPKGDLQIWVDMGTMLLDSTWEFRVITPDMPYKTLKDKKTASKSMKNMLEEMKALQDAIVEIKEDLIYSEVDVSIDFDEFTVTSEFYQRHDLL